MSEASDSKSPPLIEVIFHDPVVASGWESSFDDEVPARCRVVGWLLKDDEDRMVIGTLQGIDPSSGDEEYNSRVVIPASCIISRYYISEFLYE